MGYTAGSFTAGQQPTTAQWNVLWSNDASFNDGTGIANGAITASKLATGATTASVATNENTTSTSYTDLATATDTVTVTIGANGLALVIITAEFFNSTSGNMFVSFVASGANTIAASDTNGLLAGTLTQASWSKVLTGLSAGSTTFKLKYRVSAGTGNFLNRSISVVPL